MTQLEMTTSTDASGQRHVLDEPFEEGGVGDTSLGGVGSGDVDHLVEFVDAVGDAGRSDPLGGQDHVEPTSRSEIEHGLAWREVDHR